MTSTAAVSGNGSDHYARQKEMFNKMDADQSGSVSKSEFVSARPKGASETQSAEMFGKLDTKNAGSISFDQFAAAGPAGKTPGGAMDVVMRLQHGGSDGKGPDAAEMFSHLDGNSDGKVTKDEFVSSRPDDASAEMATKFYSSIDTDNTGSITEQQFAKAMDKQHP
jgi:Ca2+-binding EF-hand superfamily protein